MNKMSLSDDLTMNKQNDIKQYWDHFFCAETGTYEKSTWLDLLLAEFLIQLKEGSNPAEIINFCPVSGVVTLVGCELLCGIHQVTSLINSQYTSPIGYINNTRNSNDVAATMLNLPDRLEIKSDKTETERKVPNNGPFASRSSNLTSLQTLQKYLLKGSAWRCLVLLRTLGVEGLSCSRQLCSVLIWLYGELNSEGTNFLQGMNPHLPKVETTQAIQELFSNKIWTKQKVGSGSFKGNAFKNVAVSPNVRCKKRNNRTEVKPKNTLPDDENNTSESGNPNSELELLNRSLTMKARLYQDDFEYFSSVKAKDDYSNDSIYRNPYQKVKKNKPKAEHYITEKHKEILHSDISLFEFNLLVINILSKLSKAESNMPGSEELQISVQCITFALRHLCSLQFASSPLPSTNYNSSEVAYLKCLLTELLIVSLDKVLVRPDLSIKVVTNGILPLLLRLLEDIIYKLNIRLNSKDYNLHDTPEHFKDERNDDSSEKDEPSNLVQFIFGVSYSIMAFFFCFLMQCRTLDKLREFTEQFKQFGDCQKGALLKQSIALMIRIPGVEADYKTMLIKKLVESIGRLISGMKRVRSEVVHSSACPRTRHKVCKDRVAAGMHHHHGILGEATPGLSLSPPCCVSILYGTLTSLLIDEVIAAQPLLRNKILRVMLQCGSCCCFPPGYLFENLVRLMLTHRGVSSLCLSVLEHTIYGELGANILKMKLFDKLPCAVCEQTVDMRQPQRGRISMSKETVNFTSGDFFFTDSLTKYYVQELNFADSKSAWSFLIHYNSLLQLDNDNNILHSTLNHLLRVTPKCKLEMKYELLFSVIYPTFVVAKNRYQIRHDEAAYFTTISCLNMFAMLLNTVSFAEQFIQKGGLNYVLELVSLPEYSKQCCSILEIAVIVEIWKLEKDLRVQSNAVIKPSKELISLSSIRMIDHSLHAVTEIFYKISRIKMNKTDFEETINIDAEIVQLRGNADGDTQPSRSDGVPLWSPKADTNEVHIENHIESLKNVWTFWKTCACLCLYSPNYRKFLVEQSIFLTTYRLLKLSLHYICHCTTNSVEIKLLIKILESILTIQFAVSDVTIDKSISITMDILHDIFLSEKIMSMDSTSLKAICEMLIRVATTCASEEQVMPPLNKAKLPPLVCSTVSVEGDYCSTSEEDEQDGSMAGPYMSEASEPSYHTADEGYEADVEAGKVDASGVDHVYRQTTSTSKMIERSTSDYAAGFDIMGASAMTDTNVIECNEYTKSGAVTCPEVCMLVVDILMQLIEKLLITSSVEEKLTTKEIPDKSFGEMGVALARTCCARLCAALARPQKTSNGGLPMRDTFTIIERLLDGTAASLLMHRSSDLEDLQRSILDLIQMLASQSILPSELTSYLKLFMASDPPLTLLLDTLNRLIENTQPNMPDFILCFPVDRYGSEDLDANQMYSKDIGHLMLNSVASQSHQAEEQARNFCQYHLKAGIMSPWSTAALRCGIEGVSWGLWMQGFAFALWFRYQDGQMHMYDSNTSSDVHSTFNEDVSSNDSMSEWGIIGDNWKEQVNSETKPGHEAKYERKELKKQTPMTSTNNVDLLHMLSIGHESLMLESWLDTKTGNITLKLSRPDNVNNKILSECTVECGIPSQNWNFIAFNVKEIVQKRKIHIQVTLFVNGCECETASLPIQGILVRKVLPTSLLVGHSISSNLPKATAVGVWYTSGLSLFRAPVLNRYNVLYIMAHGPNTSILNNCQVKCQSPNFASLLRPTVLAANVDWDQVYEMSITNIRDLQDNLLLTYSAQSPTIMNLYHQTVSLPSGRVASSANLSNSMNVNSNGGPFAAIPETLFVVWTGLSLPGRHRGVPPAAFMLGGPDIFLYLFARIVELDGKSDEQAKALSMLLKLCYSDNRLYSVFNEEDCLSMVQTVFAASKCLLSHHILKALLDAACSFPILVLSSGRFHVMTRCDAIITEPKYLIAIIRSWRNLERAQTYSSSSENENVNKDVHIPPSVWMYERPDTAHDLHGGLMGTLFMALHVLLRDDHPHRTFNAYQMNRVNLIEHLLLYCKERFLNSDFSILSDSISCSLVELIRSLMGSPPMLCHLALLMDFLVLMHQASETFVTHSRSNFYFLLTSVVQSSLSSDYNLLNLNIPFIRKKKSSKKSSRSRNRISNSASFQSDDIGVALRDIQNTKSSSSLASRDSDIVSNGNTTLAICNADDKTNDENRQTVTDIKKTSRNSDDSKNSSLSGDAIKLNKTMANKQIKQSSSIKSRRKRKQKKSSSFNTSTYGSTSISLGEYDIQEEHQAISSEYVVIDSDEVERNADPMFSGGIFYQTRIGPGAAPGWATCEGLLLLLRDTIYVMPDTTLAQVLGVVVQSETLLVLGNHKEASVRTGVVRVVCALIQRCSQEEMKRLEACLYFYHLANQISLYPAHYDLVSSCASLVTKCESSLDDQLEESVWTDVAERSILRAQPILALLPCTLHDIPLAHNTALFLKKVIDKGSLKVLHEIGVIEVILRCLRTIGSISDTTFEGRQLILDDLRSLLNRLALKALKLQMSPQTISDIHYQLTYIELMEQSQAHKEALTCHVVEVVRDSQCSLYEMQLDYLEEKLSNVYMTSSKTSNYFATVLSSAVGDMGQHSTMSTAQGMSRSDLAAKHRSVLIKALNFIITRDIQHKISAAEVALTERLFIIIINAVTGSSPGVRPKWWASVGATDWHMPLNDLFLWIVSPLTYSEALKVFACRIVYESPVNIQQILTPNDPRGQRKLAVYMLSVLKLIHASSTPLVETTITDWGRTWALQMQAQLAHRVDSSTLADEAVYFANEDIDRTKKISQQQYTNISKSVFNKDALASKLTESAMSITRQVVDIQNAERKNFMDHLKRCQSETVVSTQKWQKLIDTYTHEHTLWHNKESYPKSWELDPTEGPGRVRVRLRRAHLYIDEKFLNAESKHKAEDGLKPSPLSYLFLSPQSVMHNGLLDRLHTNESVHQMSRVTYVTVACDQPGELLLTDRCIHFIPESLYTEGTSRHFSSALTWSLEMVVSIVTRRWCLSERALELFLNTGHAHLIAFDNLNDMNTFLKALNNSHLPNRSEVETLTEAMALWRNGAITNWEYLIRLNGWGGRSYNDLMQYPVLPFILADYTSCVIDLTSPFSYRDLRKPMAVQNKKNETHYINTYNYLKQARQEGSCLTAGVNKEPFHYGSHYSNSGTVLHFLVRLPPFTKLFLNYQDNNFDIPDRTFHSVQTTWRLTSCDSTTDVKELIPEFYYLPEFLKNSEGLQLGVRQCGEPVDDVQLPPWAPNPRMFVLIHRQALESSHATEALPYWIDLVFGFKQTGQPAVDAVNVFHPATYYGFDPSSIEDEVERAAWETMVRTYGQTPRQLLKQAHPHAATDLYHAPEDGIPVSPYVKGARWGQYCGSPGAPQPSLVMARRPLPQLPLPAHLASLAASRSAAATPRASIVITLPARQRAHMPLSTSQLPNAMALITWGHSDCMVRLKHRKELPPDILMQVPGIDSITVVATSSWTPNCSVWFGHASGRILVLRPRPPPYAAHSPAAPAPLFAPRPAAMKAHRDVIVALYVCAAFSVAVSASRDGLIVVWDLNRLCYIRTIPNKDNLLVTHICVSETLCDIVTVHEAPKQTWKPENKSKQDYRPSNGESHHQSKYKSILRVHTVNGNYVKHAKVVEKVMCVCYSNAPEGVSVNCIAAGLDTGAIRLYSSWDLRPVTYIPAPSNMQSLVSLTYSVDSQHLFAITADGTILVWESNISNSKSGNIRILTSLSIF